MTKVLVNAAAIRKYAQNTQEGELNIVIGSSVTVLKLDGTIAQIYQPNSQTITKENPFTADETGQFAFNIDPGTYKIEVKTLTDILTLTGELIIEVSIGGGEGQINVISGKKFQDVGFTLENSGDGWKIINDEKYISSGVSNIEVINNQIYVENNFNSLKLNTLTAKVNRFFSDINISCDVRYENNKTVLTLTAPITFTFDTSNRLLIDLPDYFDGDVVLRSSSQLTIDHPELISTVSSFVKINKNDRRVPATELTYELINDNKTSLFYRNQDLSGKFSLLNTSTIIYTGDLKIKPTASWNSSSNTIDVSHQITESKITSVNFVEFGSNPDKFYNVSIASSSNSTFSVRFRQYDGTIVTNPNTDLRFSFFKRACLETTETSGFYNVTLGTAIVNPEKVISNVGKIFVYARHEIE